MSERTKRVETFLADIGEVCRRHGLTIEAYEDEGGYYGYGLKVVNLGDENALGALAGADDMTPEMGAIRVEMAEKVAAQGREWLAAHPPPPPTHRWEARRVHYVGCGHIVIERTNVEIIPAGSPAPPDDTLNLTIHDKPGRCGSCPLFT